MSESTVDIAMVGRISGVFGVKGWVKITSFTEPSENIFNYRPWRVCLQGRWQELEVTKKQRHKDAWIVLLKGVDNRNDAEAYKLKDIAVDKSQFVKLDVDEFYWHELIGLRVLINSDGERFDIGCVKELIETGANDVLVIKPDASSIDSRERLIPYAPDVVVTEIDLQNKQILANWNVED